MSLIPSESFSFPDDLSRALSRARVLQETQRLADATKSSAATKGDGPPAEIPSVETEEKIAARDQLAALQALVLQQKKAAEPDASPTAKAPPTAGSARVPVPRKFPAGRGPAATVPSKGTPRPAGPKRFGPIRLPKPARISPELVAAPDAVVPLPNGLTQLARELAARDSQRNVFDPAKAPGVPVGSWRRRKIISFLVFEIISLTVLVSGMLLALSGRALSPAIHIGVTIATIAAAFCLAVLPILFFAVPAKLPRA